MTLSAPMKGWSYKKLDELGYVGRGKSRHRPRNEPSLYGGDYPFIQTADVKSAEFYIKNYSQTYNEKGLAQSKLWKPGTLCITIAANIAETAILGIPACFPDSIVGFMADPEKADVRFVKYYIEYIKLKMQNISRGTTQDNLSLDKLLTFDILAPPLPTQRSIAAILSAHDDLIENNTRRIKILEEMAQALYREWFVHFRFPGHEKVRMVDSPLGRIPEGWEIKKLGDITTKIGSGATPKGGKNSYKETGISLIRSLNVYDFRFDISGLAFIDFEQAEQLSNVIVEPRDILLNITGASVGRCCIVPSYILPARVNQHVSILRVNSDKSNPLYLLYVVNSDRYKALLLGLSRGGATREALTKSTITNFEIIHPPKDLIDKFGHAAENFFEQQEILKRKNVILGLTRELLLPKLVSGDYDISNLDIGGLNESN